MKKNYFLGFVVCAVLMFFSTFVFAKNEQLHFDDVLNFYIQATTRNLTSEYKNIKVKYQGIDEQSMLYDSLQRSIYLEVLPNVDASIDFDVPVQQETVTKVFGRVFPLDVPTSDDYVDIPRLLDAVRSTLDAYEISDTDEILRNIARTLEKYYIYPDDIPDYTEYSSISGFLADLGDEYTQYFDPDEAKIFKEAIYGEMVGIGVYLMMQEDGTIIVADVVPGGGAKQVGIQPGDEIIAINDILNDGVITTESFLEILKGTPGTTVEIQVLRNGKKIDFTITRSVVHIPNIQDGILDEDICFFDMIMFSLGSYTDFSSLMTEYHQNASCDTYVFDVRNNPGGGLEDVAKMLKYFVPKGEVLFSVEDRFSITPYALDNSLYASYFKDKQIIVLINNNSASASEIFAGVIKEYIPTSTVVGETSFGKGSVQNVLEYEYGGILKFTFARRMIGKSNTYIGGKGISPDIYMIDDPETPEDEVLEWIIDTY